MIKTSEFLQSVVDRNKLLAEFDQATARGEVPNDLKDLRREIRESMAKLHEKRVALLNAIIDEYKRDPQATTKSVTGEMNAAAYQRDHQKNKPVSQAFETLRVVLSNFLETAEKGGL